MGDRIKNVVWDHGFHKLCDDLYQRSQNPGSMIKELRSTFGTASTSWLKLMERLEEEFRDPKDALEVPKKLPKTGAATVYDLAAPIVYTQGMLGALRAVACQFALYQAPSGWKAPSEEKIEFLFSSACEGLEAFLKMIRAPWAPLVLEWNQARDALDAWADRPKKAWGRGEDPFRDMP